MSVDDNVRLLRRYVDEVWDNGNLDALAAFLTPGFRRHLSPTAEPLDRNGQIERLATIRSAFPDAALTVEDVVAAGDRVAFRSTLRGTHRGEFMGIAPTGREFAVGLVDIIRIEDGRFAEQWGGPDMLSLLQQLGARVETAR